MRATALVGVVVAVAAVAAPPPTTAGQEPLTDVRPIPQAFSDAPEQGNSLGVAETRFCLNFGSYVLAGLSYEPPEGRRFVTGAVSIWPAGEMPPELPTPEQFRPPLVNVTDVFDRNDPSMVWAWRAFYVEEPQCFDMRTINGRARVYQLLVGVFR